MGESESRQQIRAFNKNNAVLIMATTRWNLWFDPSGLAWLARAGFAVLKLGWAGLEDSGRNGRQAAVTEIYVMVQA